MSGTAYNASAIVLGITFWIAVLASIGFLVAALVRWRTPLRTRRLTIAIGLFAIGAGAIAAQQALLWWVFLPSLGREINAERDAQHEQMSLQTSLTRVGDQAPEFTVIADDESALDSANLRGKVVVLNFFATWCGPCVMELPHLQTLWKEFGQRDDFSMLVVGREETSETVAKFKMKRGFTFPMAADPERAAYDRYATSLIPRTYVVSRDGVILRQSVGFQEEEIGEIRKLVKRELDSPP